MSGKVALVTGGAKRIGRSICEALASAGYGLVIHYLTSHNEAVDTRDACLALGSPEVVLHRGDLASPGGRDSLLSVALEKFGRVDLLVNSASAFIYDDVNSFSAESLQFHLQTNYLAPVELTMALYGACSQEGLSGSHVVTLLDQKVYNLNTDYVTYTLAKLASHSSIRFLAQCCAPVLRVNAVAPGVTFVSGEMSQVEFEDAHRIAALGRSSTPQDIADAVLMLDRSRAVTGQTIVVDGGQHLVPRPRDVAFKV